MYYLFRKGQCDTMSGSGDALVVMAEKDPDAKIVEDNRWLNPVDLYLDESGNIKIKEYAPLPQSEISAEMSPPIDEERLAAFEAMAAQEARLIAHGERLAALEAALKGGEGK
jgi:hypothetical protein